MAARANPFFEVVPTAAPAAEAPGESALTRLTRLHVEAVETARLANLLGRSLSAAIALAGLGAVAVALGGAAWPPAIAWSVLMALACLALVKGYANAIGRPFERAALQCFAEDLRAGLLYAGFAWGAGAFLALSDANSAMTVVLFALAPCVAIAALLRERQAAMLFLAPVAGLFSLACVLRAFAGGATSAALILGASAAIAIATRWRAVAATQRGETALPHGLVAAQKS